MKQYEDIQTLDIFKWLQYVLNPTLEIPAIADWTGLFAVADKQKILGICIPQQCPNNIEKDFFLQWIGIAHQIERQNILLNNRVNELFDILENAGYTCCLLKGQGNANMYPHPLMRSTGDIDVWINAGESEVYTYVRSLYPDAKVTIKHIHYPVFFDVPVDIHTTPLKLYSKKYEKRLLAWIEKNKEEQFANKIKIFGINRPISVPTLKFNIVYQLGHMLIHLYDEGVGLRHIVDYFYVLNNIVMTDDENKEIVNVLKSLGLFNFARAIMWIENFALGLPIEKCIVKPKEHLGKLLLDDILEGGNFGHYSERYKSKKSFYHKGLVEAWHNIKMLRISPRECIARLFGRIETAIRYTID